MKISIRKFLLINLLLTLIATTVLTVLGNYLLDRKDIKNHLDIVLSQASFSLDALLGADFNKRDIKSIQTNLNEIPAIMDKFFSASDDEHLNIITGKYQFQILSRKGHLILRSAQAPNIPMPIKKEGFDTMDVKGELWRTFTKYNPDLGIYIVVTQQENIRNLLANRITLDDIYIMLLTYPIAGLLIWYIVGRGLRSIRKVTDEVSHRLPTYLEPVNAKSIPKEIEPLVIELNKLFLRLQQAIEREKRFAGDAAHELRTPLAALKTQAQVALKSKTDRERREQLQYVIAGVDRCAHIVQQLLTMSRLVPEANTLTETAQVDLAKLAAEIVAQLAPQALEKQTEIELITDNKNLVVQGNITALSILIRNLVDNAIRYTPEQGEIKISVYHQNDAIILQVRDNGPGIPAELRNRVFERFFRVLGNKSPGSGLGLAIVQQITQLHQAQLKLGPPPSGQGLVVEVIFPKYRH